MAPTVRSKRFSAYAIVVDSTTLTLLFQGLSVINVRQVPLEPFVVSDGR